MQACVHVMHVHEHAQGTPMHIVCTYMQVHVYTVHSCTDACMHRHVCAVCEHACTHACVHMCTCMTVHMYPVHPCTHVCMYRRAQALMYTHVNPKAHSIHIDTHTHNSINRQGKDSWIHTELVQCRDCKVRGSKEATALGSLCHPPPHLPFPQSAPSGGRGCHS